MNEPFCEKASPKMLKDKIQWAKKRGYDTIVSCPKCGRTEYLLFKNGLKNGWNTCCNGLTMPIIWQNADIEAAVKSLPITIHGEPSK